MPASGTTKARSSDRRTEQLVADAVVQSQALVHFELILRVGAPGGPAKITGRIRNCQLRGLRNTQQEIRVAKARIRAVEIVTSIHAVRIVIPAELISYRVKSDFHRMPSASPAHIVSPFEVRIRGQSLRVRLIGSGDACDVKRGNIMDTGCSYALNADLFQDVEPTRSG